MVPADGEGDTVKDAKGKKNKKKIKRK